MTNQSPECESLLNLKREACEKFLSATLLLKQGLDRDDIDTVMRSLERRSALIMVIDGLDSLIGRRQQTDISDKNPVTTGTSKKNDEATYGQLREIVSLNGECQSILSEKRQALKNDLAVIQRKEEGVHGYSHRNARVQKFVSVRT